MRKLCKEKGRLMDEKFATHYGCSLFKAKSYDKGTEICINCKHCRNA